MSADLLRVVLCWHMHQPDYRDAFSHYFQEPWTYLHALKDYTDMAAHVERVPGAKAVFDFSPILLAQIKDYHHRLIRHHCDGSPIGDPLLDALAQPVLPLAEDQRRGLIRSCLQANRRHMIERFQPYRQLADLAQPVLQDGSSLHYLDDHFIADLLIWFHLAWLGETLRQDDRRVTQLLYKGRNYSWADRSQLLQLITETLGDLLPRYQRLQEQGRIELATCPLSHPILPLLLDFRAAREAQPNLSLPIATTYPGGAERVNWHLSEAAIHHRHYFVTEATGCWPAEGAICIRTLAAIDHAGFHWCASGQRVLCNSLGVERPNSDQLHRPYRLDQNSPVVFFRDDGLSDLIGFTYKDWHAEDAVANFIHHLENIAAARASPGRVVAVILDGENAWEHYPDNGYHFLEGLYQAITQHPDFELTTFRDCLNNASIPVQKLERLVAGSWVHGNLDTWIGDEDKNRAWDMLVSAKRCWDEAEPDTQQHALEQLAICEGSDWFWWPGHYNPTQTVSHFEHLYRHHLATLYRLLGHPPPEYVEHPFTRGTGAGEGGSMRSSD